MEMRDVFKEQPTICEVLEQNGYGSVELVYALLLMGNEPRAGLRILLEMEPTDFWRFCLRVRRAIGKETAARLRTAAVLPVCMGCLGE